MEPDNLDNKEKPDKYDNSPQKKDAEQRLIDLEEKWLNKTITPEEAEEYAVWYNAGQEYPVVIPASFVSGDAELERRMLQHIRMATGQDAKVIPLPKRRLPMRWMSAAVILLLLGAGAWYFFHAAKNEKASPQAGRQDQQLANDAAPGSNKALLTLADGRQVSLNDSANGKLARQGNTTIVKLSGGQLAYHAAGAKNEEVLYNTLSTPRGGQYKLVLPDGTGVWLNAASSITYPTAFTGSRRKVSVTGEAYFEVVKNNRQPFEVQSGQMRIEVLGTHFNLNAYPDESSIRTTLLEGAVRIRNGADSSLLRPGQQARVATAGVPPNGSVIKVTSDADVEMAVAWKNGLFQFDNADIGTVMKQIARWYDVEVEYKGERPLKHFGGKISRDMNMSEILKVIAVSGVHFTIEGKKIIVAP